MLKKLVVLAALAAFFVPTASAGVSEQISSHCDFFLQFDRNKVDPIVSYGVKPSAHMHDFYGKHGVTQFTAANRVLNTISNNARNDPGYNNSGGSGCSLYGDWPAYWFPTQAWNGKQIPAVAAKWPDGSPKPIFSHDEINTYRDRPGVNVDAPPYGMTYVAGNPHAKSEEEESAYVRWTCGDIGSGTLNNRKPQDCTGMGVVTAVAVFPRCWDGTHGWGVNGWDGLSPPNFDTPAGIAPSHFVYGTPCPDGFRPIAQLITRQHFTDPRTGGMMVNPYNNPGVVNHLGVAGGLGLHFSSGPYYTYHADFLNRWNIGLQDAVRACLNHEVIPHISPPACGMWDGTRR